MPWYKSKIMHDIMDASNNLKTVTEYFLHDAVSFSDVETQLYEIHQGRLKDFDIEAVAKVKFSDVYDTLIGGSFFEVTIVTELDEKKKQTSVHLVAASDVADAKRRAEDFMRNWLCPFEITKSDKSKILAVWHPKAESWQDDFRERMLKLKEEGQHAPNINQMDIPFGAKPSDGGYVTDIKMVEKYDVAILDLDSMLRTDEFTPVKTTQFIKKHGISNRFFIALEELGSICKLPKENQTDTPQFKKYSLLTDTSGYEVMRHMHESRNRQPVEAE